MLTIFLQAAPSGGSSPMMLIMMGVMFVGFYFPDDQTADEKTKAGKEISG